jgi:glycosyltransferase involved in cell wall biosynthesis
MRDINLGKADTCVVLPVYNNQESIAEVIRNVLQYTREIIVVNDGSNDATREILENFPDIHIISYPENKGKGFALRQGFKRASELGFRYAICMDTDGQHFAEDLHKLVDASKEFPEAIIIGAREFDTDNVPGGSSFGRKFSNFWFRIETGIKHPDTQSGFRLYPLEKLQNYRWFTNRYEFEIEVIVRFAWRGGNVKSVPVKVHYPNEEERVSHFRPFKDFFRISLLNSLLVIAAFLYGLPRRLYHLIRRYSLKDFWKKYISGATDSNLKLSQSIGLGIFMGIIPLWGWQTVLAISSAHFLKLNKVFTVLAANISLPPMMPFIIFGSFYTGSLVLNNPLSLAFSEGISLETIQKDVVQYITGSLVLALIAGLTAFSISYLLLKIFRTDKTKA